MQWNESYSIGNEKIDNQHKELIAMTNKLQQSIRKGSSEKDVIETLKYIVSYTRYHFQVEEELMTRIKYPELSRQKELHEGILKKVSDIFVDLREGKMIDCFELVTFLVNWVVDHIIAEDGKIGTYINMSKDAIELNKHALEIMQNVNCISASIDKVKSLFNRGLINANDFREGKDKVLVSFVAARLLNEFNETFEILELAEKKNIITEMEKDNCLLNILPTEDIEKTISEIDCVDGKLRSIRVLAKASAITEEEHDTYVAGVLATL